jgi:hypothetical protein
MTTKVYCASKSKHAGWWSSLKSAGINIIASWPDWEFNHNGETPSPEAWSEHWQKCIEQAASCDVLLLCCLDGETQRGSLVEAGCALSAGRLVYLVTPYPPYHPQVRCFDSLAQAVEAIRELDAGG